MNLSVRLLSWYWQNRRDLPWRRSKDPYLVWLSEIIMQQTRVEQGTPYYEKFAKNYPTVQDLALAGEQEVLKLWQGLGYYSRARHLHSTALEIVKNHQGTFPETYAGLRNLKGVGDYTAAAVASICFGMPYPVMDGNVLRFISRLYGISESIDLPPTKKKIMDIVLGLIDHQNPGDFNQAMMEFGAMVCTPSNPGCRQCVFQNECKAYLDNTVGEIPFRRVKAAIRHRFFHYLVLTVIDDKKEFVYLSKRRGSDIWKNLYDFPCIERIAGLDKQPLIVQEFQAIMPLAEAVFRDASVEYTHLLTHQRLHIRFYRFHSDCRIELPYELVALRDLHKYPVPRVIDRYLSKNWLNLILMC